MGIIEFRKYLAERPGLQLLVGSAMLGIAGLFFGYGVGYDRGYSSGEGSGREEAYSEIAEHFDLSKGELELKCEEN